MGPHHLALEIAHSATAGGKSLATIIAQHKFFIDWFSIFVNNCFVKNIHTGEKQWNRLMAAK